MTSFKTAVGNKLNAEGIFLPFPGISLISFINPLSVVFEKLCWFQNEVKNSEFSKYFSLLPPESFHITLFDLLCENERVEEKWSSNYKLNCDMEKIIRDFALNIEDIVFPENVNLEFQSCLDIDITLKFSFHTSNPNSACLLTEYRNHISDITGIKHPNHDEYIYHISLGYLRTETIADKTFLSFLAELNTHLINSLDKITLSPPEFVYFQDMTEFIPIKKATPGSLLYLFSNFV